MNASTFDSGLMAVTERLRHTYHAHGTQSALFMLTAGGTTGHRHREAWQVLLSDLQHLIDGGLTPPAALLVILQ